MSSDGFYVRIGRLEGDSVTLHCLTGFAGGMTDYATSRSFALSVLLDAKDRAGDVEYEVGGAPPEVANARRELAARVGNAPSALHDELSSPEPWDEAWHQEHVPRIVASCELVERSKISEDEARAIAEEIEDLQEEGPWVHLNAAWNRLHRFDLRVRVTDPKYLAHLATGHEFGTTAFDAWIE